MCFLFQNQVTNYNKSVEKYQEAYNEATETVPYEDGRLSSSIFSNHYSLFSSSLVSPAIFSFLPLNLSKYTAERTVEEMNSEFVEFEDLIWDGQKGSKWGVIDNIHMTTPGEIF